MRLLNLFILFIAVLVICTGTTHAQSLGVRMLDDIDINDDHGCVSIRVSFAMPVRYVRHFPQTSGKELLIQLTPINIASQDSTALFNRESLSHPHFDGLPLEQVIYEGDNASGPMLSLAFSRTVRFAVSQGKDFRSIVIVVDNRTDTSGSTPCFKQP